MKKYNKLVLGLLLGSTLLVGCSSPSNWVYRPDINQGNYLTLDEMAKVNLGMTKQQIMFLLGSPMLTSAYGDSVWYYVFRRQPQHNKVIQQKLILTFDQSEVLIDMSGSE